MPATRLGSLFVGLAMIFIAWITCHFHGRPVLAQELSLHEYRESIQTAISLLEESDESLQADELAWLRAKFPSGLRVVLSEGVGLPANLSELNRWMEEAQESSDGRENLLTYLRALDNQFSTPYSTLPQDMSLEESRRILDEVYRRRELRYLDGRQPPFWIKFLDRILRALDGLLQDLLPSVGAAEWKWAQAAAYGIVLLLGALLILWIVRRLRPFRLRSATSVPITAISAHEPELNWRAWRERAYDGCRKGAFRNAIRCLFLSVLQEGGDKGWWVYETETTNREHLARLDNQPDRRDAFKQLMTLYERAWYGMSQSDEGQFNDCMALVRRLETTA